MPAVGTSTGTATSTAERPPSSSRSVYAVWEGGYRCRVTAGGFEVRVDEPEHAGGEGTGPQPTDLFLASLGSCFALAVAHVGRKRGIELADLAVLVVGAYDGPKFSHLRVEVTSSHEREELDRLVERAKAVCYVSNTLRTLNEVEVVVNPPA